LYLNRLVTDTTTDNDGVLVNMDGTMVVTGENGSNGRGGSAKIIKSSAASVQSNLQIGPMFAMNTTADGNCLLHAVSICLWGVEDTSAGAEVSLIRQGLKQFMQTNRDLLFLHYKAAERRFNATLLGGEIYLTVPLKFN
jgi:hypothetical protein